MKKLFAMLLALAMTLSLAACGGDTTTTTDDTTTDDQTTEETTTGDYGDFASSLVEEGKLIMSTNAQFPPYEMVADGEGYEGTGFEGIDIEIAWALAEKLGLELVIDDMDFDAALLAVQNNSADMMLAGLSYSEERDEVVDFSDPYATGVQVVIVKEGSDVTLDNLGEQLIGVQNGTTGWQFCSDEFGDDHVSAFDNGITAVQALMQDQVDCVVIDQGPAEVFVSENAGLTILETEYAVEDYAIGVAKGNEGLLNAINTALAELQADGTVQSIIDKYITAE